MGRGVRLLRTGAGRISTAARMRARQSGIELHVRHEVPFASCHRLGSRDSGRACAPSLMWGTRRRLRLRRRRRRRRVPRVVPCTRRSENQSREIHTPLIVGDVSRQPSPALKPRKGKRDTGGRGGSLLRLLRHASRFAHRSYGSASRCVERGGVGVVLDSCRRADRSVLREEGRNARWGRSRVRRTDREAIRQLRERLHRSMAVDRPACDVCKLRRPRPLLEYGRVVHGGDDEGTRKLANGGRASDRFERVSASKAVSRRNVSLRSTQLREQLVAVDAHEPIRRRLPLRRSVGTYAQWACCLVRACIPGSRRLTPLRRRCRHLGCG